MGSGEALSEARLEEIRRLSFHQEKYAAGEMGPTGALDVDRTMRDLLAEVERLRAREAELVAVVQAVAEFPQGQGAALTPTQWLLDQIAKARTLLESDANKG